MLIITGRAKRGIGTGGASVPPEEGEHPFEPSGMTVLTDTDWSEGIPPEYPTINVSNFGAENGVGNLSVIQPTTKPFSSPDAIRFLFDAQDVNLGGTAPGTFTNDFGFRPGGVSLPVDEIYFHFWVRWGKPSGVGNNLTGGWDDGTNAGTKIGFLFSQTTSPPNYSNIFWCATKNFGAQLETEHTPTTDIGVSNPATYGFSNSLDWWDLDWIDDGSWQEFIIYVKSNTGTSFNGIFQLYRNRILERNMNDVKFFPNSVTKRWAQFNISPTFGGGTDEPDTDQFMDFGPWYTSGKINGF